jgi:glycosyltransferase involved in cell wall biosynthesis
MDDVSDLIAAKCKYAKFVVTISNYNKRFLVQKYANIRSAKIRIIHCGVDPALFEMKSAQPARKGRFNIVSVGRLVNQKGGEPLVKALGVVRNRIGNGLAFCCRLIGDGPERDRLQSLVKTLGLTECIEFMGALDHAAVIRELTRADVFVLPCVVEPTGAADGIPVALMEAMALGVPVISTDISGIPELVKDGGGILVQAGDVEKLAGKIEDMMRMSRCDREEMAEKGRQIVRNEFNLAREAAKLERLFSDAAIQLGGKGSVN